MNNTYRDISLTHVELGQLVNLLCGKIEDIRIEQDKDPDEIGRYQSQEKFWIDILDKFSNTYESFKK